MNRNGVGEKHSGSLRAPGLAPKRTVTVIQIGARRAHHLALRPLHARSALKTLRDTFGLLCSRCLATFYHCSLMTALLFTAGSKSSAASPSNTTEIVTANTGFALDLYQRERTRPGNLFFSPYSISTCLGMAYAGARGQTATEMAHVLHFNLPQAQMAPGFADLVQQMQADRETKAFTLDIANSLWCQEGFPFIPSFLQLARNDFGAEARQVDFAAQAGPVCQEINSWVAQKTQDKIKDLLAPDQITPDTRLVLCNAIYFKGKWASPFDAKATHQAPFSIGGGQQVQASFMTRTFEIRSKPIDDFVALTLPYTSNQLSMVILLPKDPDGLPALEQRLDSVKLRQWLASLDAAPEKKTELYVPKFKLNLRLELAPTLSAMGMGLALSKNADFSGISRMPALYISDVVHQAYVDVNEEGTEAAAATGTIMRLAAAVERISVLRVDHPFLFLIRENRTGSILFLGRVMDPSKG